MDRGVAQEEHGCGRDELAGRRVRHDAWRLAPHGFITKTADVGPAVRVTLEPGAATMRMDSKKKSECVAYFARPLNPSVSIWTFMIAPRAVMYSVFLSDPAKARFCGLREIGIVPMGFPCGLKT
jgi:hypothetical protein